MNTGFSTSAPGQRSAKLHANRKRDMRNRQLCDLQYAKQRAKHRRQTQQSVSRDGMRIISYVLIIPTFVVLFTGMTVCLCAVSASIGKNTVFWKERNRYRIVGPFILAIGGLLVMCTYILFKWSRTGRHRLTGSVDQGSPNANNLTPSDDSNHNTDGMESCHPTENHIPNVSKHLMYNQCLRQKSLGANRETPELCPKEIEDSIDLDDLSNRSKRTIGDGSEYQNKTSRFSPSAQRSLSQTDDKQVVTTSTNITFNDDNNVTWRPQIRSSNFYKDGSVTTMPIIKCTEDRSRMITYEMALPTSSSPPGNENPFQIPGYLTEDSFLTRTSTTMATGTPHNQLWVPSITAVSKQETERRKAQIQMGAPSTSSTLPRQHRQQQIPQVIISQEDCLFGGSPGSQSDTNTANTQYQLPSSIQDYSRSYQLGGRNIAQEQPGSGSRPWSANPDQQPHMHKPAIIPRPRSQSFLDTFERLASGNNGGACNPETMFLSYDRPYNGLQGDGNVAQSSRPRDTGIVGELRLGFRGSGGGGAGGAGRKNMNWKGSASGGGISQSNDVDERRPVIGANEEGGDTEDKFIYPLPDPMKNSTNQCLNQIHKLVDEAFGALSLSSSEIQNGESRQSDYHDYHLPLPPPPPPPQLNTWDQGYNNFQVRPSFSCPSVSLLLESHDAEIGEGENEQKTIGSDARDKRPSLTLSRQGSLSERSPSRKRISKINYSNSSPMTLAQNAARSDVQSHYEINPETSLDELQFEDKDRDIPEVGLHRMPATYRQNQTAGSRSLSVLTSGTKCMDCPIAPSVPKVGKYQSDSTVPSPRVATRVRVSVKPSLLYPAKITSV